MVHVVTCISYDTALLSHFLQYYHSLGITSFYIAIDEQVSGIWEQTKSIASNYPVTVNLVPVSERHRLTGVEANNKEETRKEHLPKDDWIIPADLDEFIQFPTSIPTLIQEMESTGTTFIMGRFVDRISKTGQLNPTEASPAVWEQYPLECDISKMLVKCWSHKVILCHGECELTSGHHNVIRPARPLTSRRGVVHHFKWRAGIVEALNRRIETYKNAGFGAVKESERVIDYLKVTGRFIPDEFHAKEGWSPNLQSSIIYTAITGSYDSLKAQPPQATQMASLVAFLDHVRPVAGWTVREIQSESADPCRNAKIHKILPHLYFPDAQFSLWIDGSILLKDDFRLEPLVERFLVDTDIAVFQHARRKCIYDEAASCIIDGKDNVDVIIKQINRYKYESFPKRRGLAECPVILRRHTESIRRFNEIWWDEINQHSRRDQLSFNYVAWKLGVKYTTFPGNIYQNPFFEKEAHS